MKITCPHCTTAYQVPDDYIGADGRAVRCANCGETWTAKGEVSPPPKPAPTNLDEGLDTSQGDIDALFDEGGEEQSQDDIDAMFDSPAMGEEQSQDGIDSLFDSPVAGEEQSQDDIDSLFDSPAAGEDQSQDDIDSMFDSPAGGEDQGQEDIDALFDEPAAPPSANASDAFVVSAEDQAEDPVIVDSMDPNAFEANKVIARGRDIESTVRKHRRSSRHTRSSRGAENAGRSKTEWMIGASAMAASLVLVGAFFAFSHGLVRMLPDLAPLYEMVGMNVNLSGVDLETVEVRLEQKAGSPVVAVQAELVNRGAEPVLLPSIQLSILGNNATELYSWAVGPDGVGLGPGERKLIDTSVAAPSQAKKLSLRVFH